MGHGVVHARQPAAPGRIDAPTSGSNLAPRVRDVLDRYCVSCHNARTRTAGLELDSLGVDAVTDHRQTWERVVRKIRVGAMPPIGSRRPSSAEYELVASYLEHALDRAAAASPDPGSSAVARLNRAEYANAVRDLLAVEIDGRSLLPADDSGYGFDNIADVLSTSPALLERYLSAAQKVSRLAIGSASARSSLETYIIHNDFRQDARMGEEFPFGTRGGVAVRHYFPADGEYALRIRLQRQANKDVGPIRGIAQRNEIEIRVDGERVTQFVIGGPGATKKAADSLEDEKADDALATRVAVQRGMHLVTVTFADMSPVTESLLPRLPVRNYAYTYSTQTQMAVDRVQIEGPFNVAGFAETASRRRIFTCHPSSTSAQSASVGTSARREPDGGEVACARQIVSALARRAYRRPVTDDDVAPLVGFFQAGRARDGFEAGIELALTRILVSPHFLFRVERAPQGVKAGIPYKLPDLALASRLSFFLWSSLPDDELIDLAASGRLRAPGVLQAQVRRMLADTRAQALVANFFGQWLYLRNVQLVVPDSRRFPDFDNNLRTGFERETALFVESQLREDRGVMELLTADYTFLNERLARHYGIPGVYGTHFRRVTYPDRARAGLLGQGSLLTATSYADRTSPVTRGKWVLENILGTPPPPPPADVPALDEKTGAGRPRSVRERMEQHRRNPVCASCHRLMDPIGFALENFDAIGQWRTDENGTPIDPSGTLFDGRPFNGPAELRSLLAGQARQFAVTVIDKLLTYALGRGVEYYDAPAVRAIAQTSAQRDYRWSAIIAGVVESVPFQMRRSK